MESLGRAGQEMSLAALKQHDPYITSIADLTGQVALYTFCPKANQWEKTDIEGTLFVYRRSASPYHGFTIVNRLNMHNLVEPVNKDLEFQLHEPFLLYRNASLSIYSIWFYDRDDCHRIAKLMANVVEEETRRSQQAARDKQSPSQANGCSDHRPIDILEMLSRAKDEYERTAPTGHKHLTVEELFGTSLPKEPLMAVGLDSEDMEKRPGEASQKEPSTLLPFPFEQPGGGPQMESLGVQATPLHSVPPEGPAPVLITPACITQAGDKHASSYVSPLSPVLSPPLPPETPHAQMPPSLPRSSARTQAVKTTPRQRSPLLNQPVPELNHPCLIASQSPFRAPLSMTGSAGASLASVDLLQKLRLTPQQDQLQTQSLGKGAMAPSFPPAAGQLATPESFTEPPAKTATARAATAAPLRSMVLSPFQSMQQSQDADVFAQPKGLPGAIPVAGAPATTPSVLLSPSAFQQVTARSTELERTASSPSPLTVGTSEHQRKPPVLLSKAQLQDTLIHLIKNDSSFLSTLHEVYLQVLTKGKDGLSL
ncbi:mRNA-decapping enzyme 1A isoform X2 [Echinops telfairi]|uniref:5'-(N(7)-methylguanosine 5'-triphospho)-[mRNA] hydrolase n=1 Tax=Echinops telfairi TaxID=9371 RepID=A0ABM1VM38_ECHTE|nr:mRNA-decapping enzyme 1A isoform X2 [Echinops telfairi]